MGNVYGGSSPDTWHEGIPLYADVAYANLRPGIDLVFRSANGTLTFEVDARPGADIASLEFVVDGAAVSLDGARIALEVSDGRLLLGEPRFFARDPRSGSRRPITGSWRVEGQRVGLRCEGLRDGEALHVDPEIAFSALDPLGSAFGFWFLAADTEDTAFVCQGGWLADPSVIHAVRLVGGELQLIYQTAIEGVGLFAMAGDNAGRVWGTGASWDSLPIVGTPYQSQPRPGTGPTGVIVSLNSDGALDHSTYFSDLAAGTPTWWPADLAISRDASGAVHVGLVGQVSGGVNVPAPGYRGPDGASAHAFAGGVSDGFVALFSPDLSTLQALDMIGGTAQDLIREAAADAAGVCAAGRTLSDDLPVTPGALQAQRGTGLALGTPPLNNPAFDLFVVRFAPSGLLQSCTYLGGPGSEDNAGISLTPTSDAWLSVRVLSGGPGLAPSVLVRLAADGSALPVFVPWPATLGRLDANLDRSVAALPDGGACSILNAATPAPTVSPDAFDAVSVGSELLFARSDSTGTPGFTSFLGGSGFERVLDMVADRAGGTWLTGYTNSADFPTTGGESPPGTQHRFLVHIANGFESALQLTKDDEPDPAFLGQEITYTLTASNAGTVPATACTIMDELPPGMQVTSLPPGATVTGQQVTLPLPALAPGESASASFGAAAYVGGLYVDQARLTCGGAVLAETQQSTTVLSVTEQPDLVLSVLAPSQVATGQPEFSCSVRVRNLGNEPATFVHVRTTFTEKGAEVIAVDAPTAAILAAKNGAVWALGTMPPGADRTLTITVRPLKPDPIECRATLTADGLPAPGITTQTSILVHGLPADLRVQVDPPVVAGAFRSWDIQVDETTGAAGPFWPVSVLVFFDAPGADTNGVYLAAVGSVQAAVPTHVSGTVNRWVCAMTLGPQVLWPARLVLVAPVSSAVSGIEARVSAPGIDDVDTSNDVWP